MSKAKEMRKNEFVHREKLWNQRKKERKDGLTSITNHLEFCDQR
jgi:hypothetical protein